MNLPQLRGKPALVERATEIRESFVAWTEKHLVELTGINEVKQGIEKTTDARWWLEQLDSGFDDTQFAPEDRIISKTIAEMVADKLFYVATHRFR